MNTEMQRLREFKAISDRFIAEAVGRPVPWLACAGPSTWRQVYGKSPAPVYVWEIDTTQVSAGRLLSHRHLLHDISTALGGVEVRWKNHVGLGLIFDERARPSFPTQIPLSDPPANNYLIPFGVDISGQAIWRSIRETKNIVIAGSSQYGKTSGLRSWLVALTRQHSPHALKLALVDGKDFELTAFENSPYLPDFMKGHIASEVEDVETTITALVGEIKRRRQLFHQHRVNNALALAQQTGQQLPLFILVVDELKDLMDAGLDPTNLLRVAQQGLGVDVFIILSTQRPDTDTIKKSNFATIVAYRMAHTGESQVVFTTQEPYHTLKLASPGELVVLGPGLDYLHLKAFWTPPGEELPEKADHQLSEQDKLLVKVAIVKGGGDCSVNKIYEVIRQEFPKRYWQSGGPFTYHRLQVKFQQWEADGLLTASGKNSEGHNVGRQVTARLRQLAKV